jgi:two-component system, OmpR family, alkaline phosphatase synthesis response regulator PhoP
MSTKKILLIDDEQDIRRVADISLRRLGDFSVVTAASGEEGLNMTESEAPDLILLDVMMPGMDGVSVLEKLRGNPNTRRIPVIFMTARVQAREKEGYMARGARGIIDKPFDPMSLARKIREMMGDGDDGIS